MWSRSQWKRLAVLTCGFVSKLDKLAMLSRLARLRVSALRRPALGTTIVIFSVLMTLGVASTDKATASQKPLHVMNIKLYAYNKMTWEQFECYNWLIFKESRWNYKSKNGSHYGLGQMKSKWYGSLNPFRQIDVHIQYLKHRYSGDACKALSHLEKKGWH
jgi:hypothetical protein